MKRIAGIVVLTAALTVTAAVPAVAAPGPSVVVVSGSPSAKATASAKPSVAAKTAAAKAVAAAKAAAAKATAPSSPRSVTATASGASGVVIRWKASATSGTGALAGYSVTLVSSGGRAVGRTVWVGPAATTATISGLTPGSAARIDVKAWNKAVSSAAVRVWFTPAATPVDTGTAIFAVTGGRIVAFPTVDSAPVDVAAAPAAPGGYDVAPNGDVTVLDSAAGTLVRYPATHAPAVTVASGLVGAKELHLGPAGQAYLLTSGGGLVEVAADGTRRTIAASFPSAPLQLSVRPNGDVVVLYTSALRTYPHGGGAPTEAAFTQGTTRLNDIVAGAASTTYYESNSGGAVGLQFWGVDDGSGTAGGVSSTTSRTTYAAGGYGLDGSFHSVQAAQFCLPFPGPGPACSVDLSAKDLVVTSASGVKTVLPATGVALQSTTRPGSLAADGDGAVYLGLDSGATPGLWAFAPSGGTARLLESGSFTDVQVVD